MIDFQYQKDLKTQVKINEFNSGSRNLKLESFIFQNYSPYIARKILLEYCRAKDNLYTATRKSEQSEAIFDVTFNDQKNKTREPRIVNVEEKTCTCLRKMYFGYCCSHLFCAFIKNQSNLFEILPSLVHKRWNAKTENLTKVIDETTFQSFQFFRSEAKKQSKKKVLQGCFEEESNPSATKIESFIHSAQKNSETQSLNTSNFLSKQSTKKESQKMIVEIGTDKRALEAELFSENSITLPQIKLSPPKKPPTAFFIYQNERKDILRQKEPEMKWTEISKKISQEYKDLDQKSRDKYQEQASYLMECYQNDLNEYYQSTKRAPKNPRKDNFEPEPQKKKKKLEKSPKK